MECHTVTIIIPMAAKCCDKDAELPVTNSFQKDENNLTQDAHFLFFLIDGIFIEGYGEQ